VQLAVKLEKLISVVRTRDRAPVAVNALTIQRYSVEGWSTWIHF